MSNMLQFLNKTKTINARAESVLDEITRKYKSGEIKTETEYLYRIKSAVKRFYDSIGKPSFQFRRAVSTPISADYNEMLKEAYDDMGYLIQDCENLSDAISTSFMDAELSRKMMGNEIRYINRALDDAQNRVNAKEREGVVTYTDSFADTRFMQNAKQKGAASVNGEDGVLTLGVTNARSYSRTSEIEILKGSNGFPGDTHVADVMGDTIHYSGESDLHTDLRDLLDENEDTWFEYEIFSMDDEVVERCGGYGFEYKEGLSWITDDETLRLRLKISVSGSPVCNWLSLDPFLAEQREVRPSYISKCTVSDGKTQIQDVRVSQVFDGDTVIVFEPQLVDHIILEFTQSASYAVNVGHHYFTKASALKSSVFDPGPSSQYGRVDGPMPSVTLLGVKYDPKTQESTHSTYGKERTYVDFAYAKKGLFSIPADTEQVKAGVEQLPARRFAIGIRGISVAYYSFETKSEYLSQEFTVDEAITSITLEADEFIPADFDELSLATNPNATKSEREALTNKWISYYLKVGNDNKWHPIFPRHRSFSGVCTYQTNSGGFERLLGGDVRSGVGVINTLQDIKSVQLKVVIEKPTNDTYRTPILFQYSLKLTTGGENIEY